MLDQLRQGGEGDLAGDVEAAGVQVADPVVLDDVALIVVQISHREREAACEAEEHSNLVFSQCDVLHVSSVKDQVSRFQHFLIDLLNVPVHSCHRRLQQEVCHVLCCCRYLAWSRSL